MENVKEKAKAYLKQANENWGNVVKTNYLCYENDLELASEIIYKLFGKDMFNEVATFYRNSNSNDYGYTFKVLCELEENIYFQFDIITRYGIDIPQKIRNGKFRILKDIPKGWQDVWDLWEKLQDEEEE